MHNKIHEIINNILIVFNSLTSISPIIYKSDWTYYHSISLNNHDITSNIDSFLRIKNKPSLEDLTKEDIIFLNTNKNSYYALKLFSFKNYGNFIFVMGPYKDESLITFNSNNYSNNKECIYYAFKTLELIVADKTKLINNKENYIGMHINKAITLIHSNYFEDLNVENVSKMLNLNKCYFCSLFKKETGMTFSKFLNTFRVNKATALLLDMNLSILDVAVGVGFNNQNYFTIAFKDILGITPTLYRKNLSSGSIAFR